MAISMTFCIFYQETYYMPKASSRSNPAGKLYSRINYIKQSERKRDQREQEHISNNSTQRDNENILPEVASAIAWLEINKFPWTAVLSQWEVSFPARQSALRQFSKANHLFKTYPHLTEQFGYQLVIFC